MKKTYLLLASGDKNYLNELGIENTMGINESNIEEIAPRLLEKLGYSYSEYDCPNKECDWYEDCKIIKWLWFFDGQDINFIEKNRLKDYCSMKKAINGGLFDGIMEKMKRMQAN